MTQVEFRTDKVSQDVEAVFALRGWLSDQPPAFRSKIIGLSRMIEFDKGDRIANYGEMGGFYGLVSGAVGVWSSSDLTDITLGHIFRPGDWFGEEPSLTRKERLASFFALEETKLVFIPLFVIEPMMSSDPELARRVNVTTHKTSEHLLQIACELLIRDVDKRVAATILRVTAVREGVKPSNRRGFRLTQELLGDLSNVSRLQTGKVLARLNNLNLVTTKYGYVGIPNPEALADYVRNSN